MREIKGILLECLKLPDHIYNFISIKSRNIVTGKNLIIHGKIFVRGHGRITIGDNVRINSSLQSNPIGGSTRVVIHCISGEIVIGNDVGMSNCAIVCREKVVIADRVKIGGDVCIYDNDFHSINYLDRRDMKDDSNNIKTAPVNIGEDAFICAHSIILKGVSIGKRSIIAAGSVVTKSIPDDELWGGVPAKFIKKLNYKG